MTYSMDYSNMWNAEHKNDFFLSGRLKIFVKESPIYVSSSF